MDDDDWNPWTTEAADRLTNAAEKLADAIRIHAEAVTSAKRRRDLSIVFAADDALLTVVLAHADAHFEYTSSGSLFGVLHRLYDDDDEEAGEDEETTAAERPTSGILILRRHDFAVTDEDGILAAGRAAYLSVWPDGSDEDAIADVTHLGRALYQIGHADGWDSLERLDGLRPLAGVTRVIDQDDLLADDPDEWPSELFATEGEVISEQSDVWGCHSTG
jgi:hypothetical protein